MTEWWQRGVIYHIYLRSFCDADGDGVGDLTGITQRLDYLAWLGVDAVWLSPFYPSPQRDFGYDIADYTDVDPLFGSLADFDELVAEAHRLGLRVLLDFVPNHTSDTHPWFAAATSTRSGSRRNWYVWRDPAPGGGPPNNWRAVTGGSAWVWHPLSGQYYLASFLPFQPDLNWRNPDVEAALHAAMRFWLDRGADGFRVDMVDYLLKDPAFRDEPVDEAGRYDSSQARYHLNQPDLLQLLAGLRAVTNPYPGAVLLGEVEYHLPLSRLASYYGDDSTGDLLQLPFNFELLFVPWTAPALREFIAAYEAALPRQAWPNWVLGSHDVSRLATRLGTGRARAALVLLLTLRGTPILYYGDELSMTDVSIATEQIQDPWALIEPGAGRDPARTPLRWNTTANAGFSSRSATPWLPIGQADHEVDVASQAGDPASTLRLVRDLLHLRRRHPALSSGAYQPLPAPDGVLAFLRSQDVATPTARRRLKTPHPRNESSTQAIPASTDPRCAVAFLVAINLTGGDADVSLSATARGTPQACEHRDSTPCQIVVSTAHHRRGEYVADSLRLAPHEACVLHLEHT